MANMKKKSADGSNTKPYNVKLMTPGELVGGKGTKKPAPKKPMEPRKPSTGVRVPMSKTTTKAPAKMTPKPKVTKKPEKMTPQDAAMKKILEKKYGKIYG